MENKPKRILVVGDIHGNALALKEVLKACNFDIYEDKLISLGDIADGWSGTSEVVDILLNIEKLATYKPVFIRGNHDCWVYDWFDKGRNPLIWLEQGGKATINSYVSSGKVVDSEHRKFWENQVDYYLDEENRLFIHGGWDYNLGVGFPQSAMYGMRGGGSLARECHWDRSIWVDTKTMYHLREVGRQVDAHKKTKKEIEQFNEIYIGHSTTESRKVENYYNLWNMDSGAGWDGPLAIMDIITKEVWYSQNAKDLYPNERGR